MTLNTIHKNTWTIFAFLAIVIASCKQKAGEPVYLEIQTFQVSTNNVVQGTALQNFPEALLYIDDQPAGTYHLPAKIPLTISGHHNIKIAPAVIENGIASNARYAYSYMNPYDTTVELVLDASLNLQPRITYRNSVKFALVEDFENSTLLITKTTFNNVDTLLRDSLPADNLESPGFCGVATLQNGATLEYATKNQYALPSGSTSNTFLEIHYRTEVPIAIGIYSNEPTVVNKIPIVVLNPKDTWAKAYINLTQDVSAKPLGTTFRVFIASQNTSGSPKKVFLDNLKLIYFE